MMTHTTKTSRPAAPLLDPKYGRVLGPAIMATVMSLVMSLVQSLVHLGFTRRLFHAWITSFSIGVAVAIPTAIVVAPLAQRLIRYLTKPRVAAAGTIIGPHLVDETGRAVEIVTAARAREPWGSSLG